MVALAEYAALLSSNRAYTLTFSAYAVNNFGNWMSFVACLQLVEAYAPEGQSSLAVSAYLVSRLLPPLVLAPILGSVVDKIDKRRGMIRADLAAAAVVLGLICVDSPAWLPLLFPLVFAQFALAALYDPLRRSLQPRLVPKEQLQVATTLDGVAWSTIAALAAALGGAVTSSLGVSWCFALDTGSYLLSALLVSMVDPKLSESVESAEDFATEREGGATGACADVAEGRKQLQRSPLLLLVCFAKAFGALVWGAADVLAVRFSETPQTFGQLGDSGQTLGYIFSAVGVGCLLGPTLASKAAGDVQDSDSGLLGVIACGFGLLFVGYLAMVLAIRMERIEPVLLSSALRSSGSSIIWIYSTLLLQLRGEEAVLGRLFAFEIAVYTIFEGGSTVWGGVAFDVFNVSLKDVCVLQTSLAGVVMLPWCWFWFSRRRLAGGRSKVKYSVVSPHELDDVDAAGAGDIEFDDDGT